MDQNPVWSSDNEHPGALLTSPLSCNILLFIGRWLCKKVWCQDVGHPGESEVLFTQKVQASSFEVSKKFIEMY